MTLETLGKIFTLSVFSWRQASSVFFSGKLTIRFNEVSMRFSLAVLSSCLIIPVLTQAQFDYPPVANLLGLQPFAEVVGRSDTAELVNVNPELNSTYFLLTRNHSFHFEVQHPEFTQMSLQEAQLAVQFSGIDVEACKIAVAELVAISTDRPYATFCDGMILARFPQRANRTTTETVTTQLRDWGLGWLVEQVKEVRGVDDPLTLAEGQMADVAPSDQGPLRAAVAADLASVVREPEGTSFTLQDPLFVGGWARLRHAPGVYFSQMKPQDIDSQILSLRVPGRSTNALNGVELNSGVNLVAFDLSQFSVSYHVGSNDPQLGWSNRPQNYWGQRNQINGPDGFSDSGPFVRLGVESPWYQPDSGLVAHLTAGFLRSHGAFKWGPFAEGNHGHHYGMIENGVVLSRLMPGLATFILDKDGRVDLRTWTEEPFDPALPNSFASYANILSARQNGVPLVEWSEELNRSVPGEWVDDWGPGNWSGDAHANLQSMRSALCLQDSERGRFLIYAHFSSTTPSAMARTLMAYQCRYAVHLDMNAYMHTYAVVYGQSSETDGLTPEYLMQRMQADVDGSSIRYLETNVSRDRLRIIRRR
jgi:hypothetical protein